MVTLITKRHDGFNGVIEHIMKMNNLIEQFNFMSMIISESFIIQFIFIYLPSQFCLLKIHYNI
jgi:hypothetical protein